MSRIATVLENSSQDSEHFVVCYQDDGTRCRIHRSMVTEVL